MEHPSSNNSNSNSHSGSPDSQHSNGSAGKTHTKPQQQAEKNSSNSNSHNNSNSSSSSSNSHSNSGGNNSNSNSGSGSNNHVSANNAALLPQLETIERMMKLPVVEAAWHQGQAVYDNVKGYNAVFGWALRTAETAVHTAVNTAAPLVQRLDGPISYVDQTLVTGIEALEAKAPIIKEQPQEIYAQARSRVVDIVQPHVQKVCSLKSAGVQRAASLKTAGVQRAASLKELSWQKANEVLATQYGSMAVDGLDTTSALAERLLDYYFPKADDGDDDEAEDAKDATVAAGVDPVLHTCQTVGRLSNKVARRVYRTVSRQVKQLKKEDVHEYVASLIAVLRLTQYLNFINEKVQTNSSIEAATSSSSAATETVAKDAAKAANGNSSNHGSPKSTQEAPAAAAAIAE